MPVTLNSVLQVLLFLVIVLLLTKPIGLYLTHVFAGDRTWLSPAIILGFTAVTMVLPQGLSSIANNGPHGLTEVLYLFTSSNGNNGSAFAGINGNTPFYNWTGGFAMLLGRFAELIPILAFGGSLVRKRVVPAGLGTFPTTGLLFVALVIGVILIVGALTYFPAYSLGPIVEHLLLQQGRIF